MRQESETLDVFETTDYEKLISCTSNLV
jgi:hypothetical protein